MELVVIYYVKPENLGYDHDNAVRIDHEIVGVYKDDNSKVVKAIIEEYENKENHFIEYITLGQII